MTEEQQFSVRQSMKDMAEIQELALQLAHLRLSGLRTNKGNHE